MKPSYHIGISDISDAKYAILPGDPGRVEKIASFLDNPGYLGQKREYTSWIGKLEDKPVLVISTGMGGPSTAIAVEELAAIGVKNFIRIGTCGGMAEHVRSGDLVIATAAVRQEGTSKEYVPVEFPAVADLDITNALVKAAKTIVKDEKNTKYITGNEIPSVHAGVVHSKDSFYGQHSPGRMPAGYELKNKWEAWIRARCLASEMEAAALFIVAQILGVRAGCVLNVVWNQTRASMGYKETESTDPSLAVIAAVEAVRMLIKEDKKENKK